MADETLNCGAKAAVNGGPTTADGKGFFHEPVVLTGAGNDAPIARRKIFARSQW